MSNKRFTFRTTVAAMTFALALPAAAGTAQPGPAVPGGPKAHAAGVLHGALAQLDLTQEQKDKVKAVVQEEKVGLEAIRARNRVDSMALRELTAAPQPDPKAVGEALLKVRANGESARAAREKLLGRIGAILTPAQKAKFDGYLQAARDAGRAARARRTAAPGQGQ